jgi:hypothetical protein
MERQAKGFPPHNEQVGRGSRNSQPGEGGLGHPQAAYMSPKPFLLLACLTLNYCGQKGRVRLSQVRAGAGIRVICGQLRNKM